MELVAILLAAGAGAATWYDLYVVAVTLGLLAVMLHITATAQYVVQTQVGEHRRFLQAQSETIEAALKHLQNTIAASQDRSDGWASRAADDATGAAKALSDAGRTLSEIKDTLVAEIDVRLINLEVEVGAVRRGLDQANDHLFEIRQLNEKMSIDTSAADDKMEP